MSNCNVIAIDTGYTGRQTACETVHNAHLHVVCWMLHGSLVDLRPRISAQDRVMLSYTASVRITGIVLESTSQTLS